MDHLSGLVVDGRLVPPAYVSWGLWHEGARAEALETLEQALSAHFGRPVIEGMDHLVERSRESFRGPVRADHVDPAGTGSPSGPGRPVLWRQVPRDTMLSAIVLGDLRWADDPFEEAVDVPGATELVDSLRSHEQAGLISRDPHDVPFGGRPVLSTDLLAAAERARLSVVYDELAAPASGSESAESWFAFAASNLPGLVLRTFVHDAYVAENGRSGRAADAWHTIQELHPAYASAVRSGLGVDRSRGLHDRVARRCAIRGPVTRSRAARQPRRSAGWLTQYADMVGAARPTGASLPDHARSLALIRARRDVPPEAAPQHARAMPGPAKGRKSGAAPVKGKAAAKGGAGHTHIQSEPSTTSRRGRRTRPPEVGGQQKRRVDADRQSATGAARREGGGTADRPCLRQEGVRGDQPAVPAGATSRTGRCR